MISKKFVSNVDGNILEAEEPTLKMRRDEIAAILATCDRASERSLKVAEKARFEASRKETVRFPRIAALALKREEEP